MIDVQVDLNKIFMETAEVKMIVQKNAMEHQVKSKQALVFVNAKMPKTLTMCVTKDAEQTRRKYHSHLMERFKFMTQF